MSGADPKKVVLKRGFASSRLVQDIRNKINSGELLPGDPLVSERALTELYGISLVTVRRALAQMEEEGLIEKKWGDGNYVKGKPKREQCICILVPNLRNYIFSEYLRETIFQAGNKGYHVVVGDADNSVKREEAFIHNCAERGILKILKFPNILAEEERLRSLMSRLGMQFVIVNDFWADLPGRQVKVDDAYGTKLALEHLFELGHRNIAYLEFVTEIRQAIYGTYRAFLEQKGCYREDSVFFDSYSSLFDKGLEFLSKQRGKITACLLSSDYLAIHFLENLISCHNFKIPEEMAIIGFDDILKSSKPSISLTTIRQPREGIVEKALELLLDMDDNDDSSVSVKIKPELIVRRSTDVHYFKKEEDFLTALWDRGGAAITPAVGKMQATEE